MRNYIVGNGHYPGVAVAAHQPRHGTQRRPHKRQPKPEHHQVGPLAPQPSPHRQPRQGIYGVQAHFNRQIRGPCFGAELRLARKQEIRVLQRKRDEPYLVARRTERTRQLLVIGGQPAAQRVSWPDDDHAHTGSYLMVSRTR